jgi:hypothetical protein
LESNAESKEGKKERSISLLEVELKSSFSGVEAAGPTRRHFCPVIYTQTHTTGAEKIPKVNVNI